MDISKYNIWRTPVQNIEAILSHSHFTLLTFSNGVLMGKSIHSRFNHVYFNTRYGLYVTYDIADVHLWIITWWSHTILVHNTSHIQWGNVGKTGQLNKWDIFTERTHCAAVNNSARLGKGFFCIPSLPRHQRQKYAEDAKWSVSADLYFRNLWYITFPQLHVQFKVLRISEEIVCSGFNVSRPIMETYGSCYTHGKNAKRIQIKNILAWTAYCVY